MAGSGIMETISGVELDVPTLPCVLMFYGDSNFGSSYGWLVIDSDGTARSTAINSEVDAAFGYSNMQYSNGKLTFDFKYNSDMPSNLSAWVMPFEA